MTQLTSVVQHLDSLLTPSLFEDRSLNGLQVESGAGDVRRVAFAVDGGMSICQRAVDEGAQLLVVHHGIFWGEEQAIAGPFGRKIELLLKHKCSLYASHLPLDAHPEVGNNFEMARYFGFERIEPYFEHRGRAIGARAALAKARPLDTFVARATELRGGTPPLVLPFGPGEIRTVGVITGAGGFGLKAASEAGIDLFLSGEPKQELYHLAKELHINAIFAGHYRTETFGVRALERRLREKFDLQTVFIDEDTGI